MEDWHRWAMEMALELAENGEVVLVDEGERFAVTTSDVVALGIMVLAAGPERTAEVVCSWLDRAHAARAQGDA